MQIWTSRMQNTAARLVPHFAWGDIDFIYNAESHDSGA